MDNYYVYVIASEGGTTRIYTNGVKLLKEIQNNPDCTYLRSLTNQVASIKGDRVIWIDIEELIPS